MNAALWVVATVLAVGAILTILNIGKEREPITPGVAATALVIQAIVIALIFVGAE